MILLVLCVLAGALLIWRAADTVTISREEAIQVKATFQQAIEQWNRHRGKPRYRRSSLCLTFSDHEEMNIRYNLDDVVVAEELPYTDKRRRPVLLADLSSGTVCTILADPQEPNSILHLETEEGTVMVSFEASMETAKRKRENGYVFGGLLTCGGALGILLEMYLYRKQKRTIRR